MSVTDSLVDRLIQKHFPKATTEQVRIVRLFLKTKYETLEGLNLERLSDVDFKYVETFFDTLDEIMELDAIFSLPPERLVHFKEAQMSAFLKFTRIAQRILHHDVNLFSNSEQGLDGFGKDDFKKLFDHNNDLNWLQTYLYANPKYAFLWKLDPNCFKRFVSIISEKNLLANPQIKNFRAIVMKVENPKPPGEDHFIYKKYYSNALQIKSLEEIVPLFNDLIENVKATIKKAEQDLMTQLNLFLKNRYNLSFDNMLEYNVAEKKLKMPDDPKIYEPITPNVFKIINGLYGIRYEQDSARTITDLLEEKGKTMKDVLTSDASQALFDKYIEQSKTRHYRFKV